MVCEAFRQADRVIGRVRLREIPLNDPFALVEGTGSIFLAGSHLVQAAIGEKIDNEELGGALVQCDVSGVVDHRHPNDTACLEKIRSQFAQLAAGERAPFARRAPAEPLYPVEDLYGIMPVDRSRPYDTYEVLARLLDGSELDEYKATYGQTLICGTGWIGGWALGLVANQRSIVPRRTGTGPSDRELQIGVLHDHHDVLAAHLELTDLVVGGGALPDDPSDLGRAGE